LCGFCCGATAHLEPSRLIVEVYRSHTIRHTHAHTHMHTHARTRTHAHAHTLARARGRTTLKEW